MTITVWRIYRPRHRPTAFSGEGARLYGGRWNSRGVPVVYTSGSIALAALELLIHLQAADVRLRFELRPVRVPARLVAHVASAELPSNWRSSPPPPAVQRIGDEWFHAAGAPVLRVPSVAVPQEHNYLLNPRHPDFSKLELGNAELFEFDPRLA